MPRILSSPQDIRQWVEARACNPKLMDVPDGTGGTSSLLQISFGQHPLNADQNEGPDRATGGYQLVGWDEWFAEFDRQNLGIKVRDEQPGLLDNDFEFVARDGRGRTPDAARQPPVATVEDPGQQAKFNRGE